VSQLRLLLLWLMWKALRWPSVILFDHDQEMNARLVRGTRSHPLAARMPFGVSTVRLMDDGAIEGPCYVKRWEPLFPPPIPPADRQVTKDIEASQS
jgi:hypothetical protein